MRVRNDLSAARTFARENGMRWLLRRIAARVHARLGLARFFRRSVVVASPWRENTNFFEPARIDVEAAWLWPDDVDEYVQSRLDSPWPADAGDVRRRLELGHLCAVVRHEGRIVGSGWIVRGRACLDELQLVVELDPTDLFNYDVYTSPDMRGKRVHNVRSWFIRKELEPLGYGYSHGTISPENRSSMRLSTRGNWAVRGYVGYFQLLRLRLDFTSIEGRGRRLSARRAPRRFELVSRSDAARAVVPPELALPLLDPVPPDAAPPPLAAA